MGYTDLSERLKDTGELKNIATQIQLHVVLEGAAIKDPPHILCMFIVGVRDVRIAEIAEERRMRW